MKTKKIIMLIAIFLAIGIGGCREDSPLPTPPPSPLPPISLSTSEVWLMVGMEAEVMISNSKEFSVSAEKSGMITTRIEGSKIFMGALTPGEVSLIISDIKDHSRRAVIKVKVIPLKSGIMNGEGEMVFEAKYCFQTTKTLHLAPFGALRKEHYLRVPMQKKLQVGATVSFEYKTPGAEKQTLQAKIFVIKDKTIYATMPDGGYLIFEKK